MTNTVEDAALIMKAIEGHDRRDSTSAPEQLEEIVPGEQESLAGMRIGLPRQYRDESNDPTVDSCMNGVVEQLQSAGAKIVDIDLPLTDTGISTYYVIAPAEASSNLARFDGIRYGFRARDEGGGIEQLYARTRAEGFGPEVQRRIMLGTYVLSAGYYDAYYNRALHLRRLIKSEFDAAFQQCDVLLGPTSPFPAFPLGGKPDPMSMYLCDVYTVNANIAGICAISIPAGLDDPDEHGRRRPIGLHLQAPAFADSRLLRTASAVERLVDFASAVPS